MDHFIWPLYVQLVTAFIKLDNLFSLTIFVSDDWLALIIYSPIVRPNSKNLNKMK
jgi:hypothetical protein